MSESVETTLGRCVNTHTVTEL